MCVMCLSVRSPLCLPCCLDVPVSPVKRSPSTFGKAVYAHRLEHCGPGGASCLLCMPNAHWLHRLLTMQSAEEAAASTSSGILHCCCFSQVVRCCHC